MATVQRNAIQPSALATLSDPESERTEDNDQLHNQDYSSMLQNGQTPDVQMHVLATHWPGMYCMSVTLWIVGVVGAWDLPWPCPQRCECLHDLLIVNCSSIQLTSVPEGVYAKSLNLNLSNNHLRTLERWQFSSLGKLEELDLSENMLSMIKFEAFLGLQNLVTLRLSRNRLKILPLGVFSGLLSLRLLDISKNEILIFLDHTFREMASLQKLDASKNDIVFISNLAFSGLLKLQELNLDRCNITSAPALALSQLTGLTRLQFCWVGLTLLPNNTFRRLSWLRELTVSNCPWLSSLATNSLIGLNLTSLTLSYCSLTSVPYVPLQHLVYLRYLDLSYNPITSIQPNQLGALLRLQEFHLVGGSLLRVEPRAFQGLAHLRLLNASSNQLSTLEEMAFHSTRTLQVLRLDGNRLTCDCRLQWVLHNRLHLNFDDVSPVCASPPHMQGRMFWDFSMAEVPRMFTCRQARILNRKPQEVRTDQGRTVLFFCQVDGDPAPSLIWVSPHRILLTTIGRIRVLSNGTLEVRNAQVQDSGYYYCFASNAAGNDSISVSLRVCGSPESSFQNNSVQFFLEGWNLASILPSVSPTISTSDGIPFDMKTLVIVMTMGFMLFLSSVAVCFVFIFFWSQGKGRIKHTAKIAFVPRSTAIAIEKAEANVETAKLTMRL